MSDKITLEEASIIMKSFGKSKLTALQRKAFSKLEYYNGAREFIIGNTSSGKTLVPLAAFKKAIRKCEESKLLYIVPYRALAAQKKEEFENLFSDFTIKMSTSEYCMDDSNVIVAKCDMAIVIYEKAFQFQARDNNFFQRYSHVVFDEIGIVENTERGFKAEFLLNCACNFKNLNIYALATPFYNWIKYINCYDFHMIESKERPVDIKIVPVILDGDENKNQRKTGKITELCRTHLERNQKILLFANNKAYVRKMATSIGEGVFPNFRMRRDSCDSEINKIFSKLDLLSDDILGVFGGAGDISAYKNGIAFHNASLPDELRELIEEEFLMTEDCLKIVCATETLAFGINSNVDVVIVASIHKYDRGEKRILTPNEIYNYIGRAGRYGIREQGIAYIILSDEDDCRGWEKLRDNSDEVPVLFSTLCSTPHRNDEMLQVLHLFSDGKMRSAEEILEKIKTYPMVELTCPMKKRFVESINMLVEKKLITREYDDFDMVFKYRISDKGRRVLGFILETDTYDELARLGKNFFVSKKNEFDIIYTLSGCTDIKNIMPKLTYNSEDPKSVDKFYKSVTRLCMNIKNAFSEIHRKMRISNYLYDKIYNSSVFKIFHKNNILDSSFIQEPGESDWEIFNRLRLSIALYMWINAFNAKEIYYNTDYNYSTMVNMGNKFKYLIDTLVIGFAEKMDESEKSRFQLLGVSLFYGIGLGMLSSMMNEGIFDNLNQIEPKDGRQLRAVSQTIMFYQSAKCNDETKYREMYDHCQKFKKKYVQYLNKTCPKNMR
jgi:replicative superfamily II helicase